jgi:hypothetical protein
MARPGMSAITVKPSPNVYTGLAFISMAATAAALGYVLYMWFMVFSK